MGQGGLHRFEKAMRWACEHFQDDDRLDRWMAEGFHHASWFFRGWHAYTEPHHWADL
jgi:hypothetical protein